MATVAQVVDRVYREGVRLASQQPLIALANAAYTSGDTTIALDVGTFAVDEQDNVAPGLLLEAGLELILVKTVSLSSDVATCTVVRGFQGTTAAAISSGDPIVVAPDAPRVNVFNAVCDEVQSLYPRLWAVQTDAITSASTYTEVDADAVSVESFRWLRPGGGYVDGRARLLRDFTPSSTTKAVVFEDTPSGKTGYITLRLKFARPTAEADDLLATFGVQEDWTQILVYGAIARVLTQMDPSRLSVEWTTELNEAQVSPPGGATALAQRFQRMRDDLLEEAAIRWRTEHPTTVKVTSPFHPWAGAS